MVKHLHLKIIKLSSCGVPLQNMGEKEDESHCARCWWL
jgi:hypothetical protein